MSTKYHEKYYNYTQFITTNVYNRIKIFLIDKYCKILLKNINFYRKKYNFKLYSYVIMPDHCHFLIESANEKGNISQIMHDWKSYTSQIILNDLRKAEQGAPPTKGVLVAQAPCLGRAKTPCLSKDISILKNSGHLWQERFDSFPVLTEQKFQEKLNYIHNNPLKAGLVKDLTDYQWSSYQNYFMENNLLIHIDY